MLRLPALASLSLAVLVAVPSVALGATVRRVDPLAHAASVGAVPATAPVHLSVELRPSETDLLARRARHASATRPHGVDRFLPEAASARGVTAYLRRFGLRPAGQAGLSLFFDGTAKAAEQAFSVDLRRFRGRDGRTFFAPDRTPRLPAALQHAVRAIGGLSTAAAPRPATAPTASVAALPGCTGPGPDAFQAASGAYQPADLAGANGYDYQPLLDAGADGSGQVVALVEFSNYLPADVMAFQSCYGLNVPVSDKTVAGGTASRSDAGEDELDIETLVAAAPGLDHVYVYIAPKGASMASVINKIVADQPRTSVDEISISWGICEPLTYGFDVAATNDALQLAAVAGIGVYAASGDHGSSDCAQLPGLAADEPAAQPYATAVGGTDLHTMTGVRADPTHETTWNRAGGSGGGGISIDWPKPWWQDGAGVANSFSSGQPCNLSSGICRELPDVALAADPADGYIVYCTTADCGGQGWTAFGGTSGAAPLMAAVAADASSYSAANGGQRLGFASPFLYAAYRSHPETFHDVTLGTNDVAGGTTYPATSGYDLASGLGSFDAAALAANLAATALGSPAIDPSRVVASSPATIRYGQTTTFSGTVREPDGTPVAGRLVALETQDRAHKFREWWTTTDARGRFAVRLGKQITERTTWQVVYLGDDVHRSATSALHVVHVAPRLTLSANLRKRNGRYVVRAGHSFSVTALASPSMGGQRVALQYQTRRGWQTIFRHALGAGGLQVTGLRFSGAGRAALRWSYTGSRSGRWLSSTSPAAGFTVTR